VLEVNPALGGRRADGDENEGGVLEGVVAGQGGAEALFGKDAAEQLRQARLVDVGLGAVELFHDLGAEIEANDLVALGRQANARNQADVARSKNGNLHSGRKRNGRKEEWKMQNAPLGRSQWISCTFERLCLSGARRGGGVFL